MIFPCILLFLNFYFIVNINVLTGQQYDEAGENILQQNKIICSGEMGVLSSKRKYLYIFFSHFMLSIDP